ncbi:MAG: acyl-CoA thioesterase [Clostridia bacterium]|nr:acyl-CoA thioesterase [Clostridia bacterium]
MHVYSRKANYYEIDQMGIVHHSNYIRWFEEARIELMDQLGLPYKTMEEAQVLIPVLGVDCAYKHPIRFGETIVLELRIQNYTGTRFEVAYTGYCRETGQLSCTGTTQHCFTTPDLRPIRLNRSHPEWHEVFLKASSEE